MKSNQSKKRSTSEKRKAKLLKPHLEEKEQSKYPEFLCGGERKIDKIMEESLKRLASRSQDS